MNRTNFDHAVIAVIIQFALWPILGLYSSGIFAVAVFIGREYAQVEYKVRDDTGISLTNMMPWHIMKMKYFTLDGFLDWFIPAIFCFCIAALAG